MTNPTDAACRFARTARRVAATTTAQLSTRLATAQRTAAVTAVSLTAVIITATQPAAALQFGGNSNFVSKLSTALVKALKQFLRDFFSFFGADVTENIFAQTFVFLVGTPLPESANQYIPTAYQRPFGLFNGVYPPLLELNELFVELSVLVLAIYLALLLGGIATNFIRPSRFYKGTLKTSMALILLSINVELLGFLFGILRILTVAIFPNPKQMFVAVIGFTASAVSSGPTGLAMTGAFATLSLLLMYFLALVLAVRVLIVYFLFAGFPLVISSYTLASDFDGAKRVYDSILGFTLPTVVVILPVAGVFRVTAIIFGSVDPSSMSLGEIWILSFMGAGAFLVGIILVIKTTTVGRLAMKTALKGGGLLAFGGAAMALGGSAGFARSLRARAIAGNSAGLMSAANQGMRQTQDPEADSPMASKALTKFPGVEEQTSDPDPVVNGTDYSDPRMQYANEHPGGRNNIEWEFNNSTAQLERTDDVVEIRGGSVSGGSWNDVSSDTGENAIIRQHPKDPEKMVIQHQNTTKAKVAGAMALTGLDAEYDDEWDGFVTDTPITEAQLDSFSSNLSSQPADSVYVDRNAVINGNVEGSRPPVRNDNIGGP
jgi:hypothetical protein